MTQVRKTTVEERIEIVSYRMKNQRAYQRAAEVYKVSYQQVYQWVKKYENSGIEALYDKRGRTKLEIEVPQEETLKREMKKLERENERLRAENLFLKKVG
ncbi:MULTISPECIES: helix-turn-helix domain-containing protein [Priestia]|uniref:helix-turn-helix domain-containing protein n=1 Tax=Priestia TaxID=2800373 RepID=UPI00265AEEAA|nr:helix-turn-helix domain-containing protein [Priestia aryabhattai]WKG29854.1 helix-turn-helix domain-containing protein [Priestia aryabhattai]